MRKLVAVSALMLLCTGLEWPGRVAHLKHELARGEAPARQAALRRLAGYAPADVGEPVLRALEDGDARVRRQAARAAARLQLTEATPVLLGWLAERDPELRQVAVESLGDLHEAQAAGPLTQALSDALPSVRRAAALALGQIGDTDALLALEPLLDDADPSVREAAAKSLHGRASVRAFAPLAARLRDDVPAVRIAAAEALGALADPRAVPILVEAAQDQDDDVELSAVMALGALGEARGSEAIVAALSKKLEAEPIVAKAALAALGRTRGAASLALLLRTLGDPDLARSAAAAVRERVRRQSSAASPPVSDAAAIAGSESARAARGSKPAGESRESRASAAAPASESTRPGATSAGARAAGGSDPNSAAQQTTATGAGVHAAGESSAASESLSGVRAAVDPTRELADVTLARAASESERAAAAARMGREHAQLMAALAGALGRSAPAAQVDLIADLIVEIAALVPADELREPLLAAQREGRGDPSRLTRALAATDAPEALVPLLERLARLDDKPDNAAEVDALLGALSRYFAAGLSDGRASDPLLARLAATSRKSTRAALIRLIGWTGAVRAVPALAAELASPDRALRLASLEALGRISSAESHAATEPYLFAASQELRLAAARALAGSASDADIPRLLGWLDGDTAADRGALLLALGLSLEHLRETQALSPANRELALESLGHWASDPDPRLSAHALDALRRLNDARAARAIAHELLSPKPTRRAAATFALGSFPHDDTQRLLRFTLQQRSAPRVTLAATLALGAVGDERDVPALVKLARYSRWPVPAATSYALRRISGRGDVRRRTLERSLCALRDERNQYVRANLASTLTELGGSCPDLDIRAWLAPAEPSAVRAAAGHWLRRQLSEQRAPDPADARAVAMCAADPDALVRAACAGVTPSDGARALELLAYDTDGETLLRDRLIALRFADTSVFVGYTDENARIIVPAAPSGPVVLEDPAEAR